MAGYVYDKTTGKYYEVDESGNMIFTNEAPAEGTEGVYEATRLVTPSEEVRRSYTISKYNKDTDGYKLRREGRQQQRNARREILGGFGTQTSYERYLKQNYTDNPEFSKFFRKNGNLRRRALKDESFLNALASRTYNTDDKYQYQLGKKTITKTLGKKAKTLAQYVNSLVNPTLAKKTESGKVVSDTYTANIWDGTGTWQEKEICPQCHDGRTIKVWVPNTNPVELPKLAWEPATYDKTKGKINENIEYSDPVVENIYAVPVQLTPHSETETKPGTSTPGTPGTTDTPKPRPRLRTKVRSTPSNPPIKKSIPTPGTSTPDQVRTVTWQTFPDGSIVEDKQYTDWKDVK